MGMMNMTCRMPSLRWCARWMIMKGDRRVAAAQKTRITARPTSDKPLHVPRA